MKYVRKHHLRFENLVANELKVKKKKKKKKTGANVIKVFCNNARTNYYDM